MIRTNNPTLTTLAIGDGANDVNMITAGTLEFIKSAGIKVWVLTGDKIETAINIGISCKLLNVDMETFIIDAKLTKDVMLQIT